MERPVGKLVVLVLMAIALADSSFIKDSEPFLAQSVAQIIKDFYTTKGTSFHMMIAVDGSNRHSCDDIISEVLKSVSNTMPAAIENFTEMKKVKDRKKFSVIVFTDSLRSVENFFEKFNEEGFNFGRYFTVVLINRVNIFDVKIMFDFFWKHLIRNVNLIMTSDSGNVDLFTFLPFNHNKCGDTRPLIINDFDKDLMKWKHEIFHPSKTRNLHKCPLLVTAGVSVAEPALMTRNDSKGNVEVYGSEKDIVLELAEQLNFKPNFETFGTFPGLVFENGTSSGFYLSN